MLLDYDPQPYHTPITAAELAPIFANDTESNRQLLMDDVVQCMNTNETTVHPATVQAHIEDIYTPGDRACELKYIS